MRQSLFIITTEVHIVEAEPVLYSWGDCILGFGHSGAVDKCSGFENARLQKNTSLYSVYVHIKNSHFTKSIVGLWVGVCGFRF